MDRIEIHVQSNELNYGFDKKADIVFYKNLCVEIAERSLKVTSVHAPRLTFEQVFTMKAKAAILDKCIEILDLLEGEVLVIHPEHVFKTHEDAETFLSSKDEPIWNHLIGGTRELLTKARDHGLLLGLENIKTWFDYPLLNNTENMLKVIDSIQDEGLCVALDVLHSELAGISSDFIKELRKRIVNISISDLDSTRQRIVPGEGKIRWELLVPLLKTTAANCLVFELAPKFDDNQLLRSMKYITSLL